MITIKKANQRSTVQADIEFDHDFVFNINDVPEKMFVNHIIKTHLKQTLSVEKTIPEHIAFVNMWVEELLELKGLKITLDDLGLHHHNFRSQLIKIFQSVSSYNL